MEFRRKWIATISFLLLILILSIAAATAIGPVDIPVGEIFKIIFSRIFPFSSFIDVEPDSAWYIIVWKIRLPQVILGVLVGFELASAVTAMQGLFKNPMADPFIIGVSAGAALGAVLAITIGNVAFNYDVYYLTPIFSFAGALMSVYLVYSIARSGGRISVPNLLLAGIAINMFLSAMTSMIIYIKIRDTHTVIFWLIGSLGASSWKDIGLVAPIIIPGIIVLCFIGLIIPHIMRLLVGPDHRLLLPSSALFGGIFLIWCDTISRTQILGATIPVALITSLFGGPFFIYLLWRRKVSGGSW
jgi:iron complex transport system permease protein